jgi:hypothetical protein
MVSQEVLSTHQQLFAINLKKEIAVTETISVLRMESMFLKAVWHCLAVAR